MLFQTIFYLIVKLITIYTDIEQATHTGRIDMLIQTHTHIYIFEFKLNKSAQEAMDQINIKPTPGLKAGDLGSSNSGGLILNIHS